MGSRVLVLLRGINVGGNKKVPMAELRQLAAELGYDTPKTYIASGNLLITTDQVPEDVVATLAPAIEKQFGFAVDLVVKRASEWAEYSKGGVYPEAEKDRSNLVHIALSTASADDSTAEAILEYAKNGERVMAVSGAIWLDYPDGSGRSKITPKVLDRAFGAPVTSRNFRTVQKLATLLSE